MVAATGGMGLVKVISLQELQQQEKKRAETENQEPLIQGLAAYVRDKWEEAKTAKYEIEVRMLQALRQRRGEYDPDKLQRIRQQGGSEVYMMLTNTKCRAAAAWLRDALLGQNSEKPWNLKPTPMPELPDDVAEEIFQEMQEELGKMQQEGIIPNAAQMRQLVQARREMMLNELHEYAVAQVEMMERKMEDQLLEGGYIDALSQFIEDLVTFPAAILKGPVVRKRPRLKWVQTGEGQYDMDVSEEAVLEWERVDPFNIYPAPNSSGPEDGPLCERHRLSRRELRDMIGVDGYNDDAIRAVLDEYGRGGLHDWLWTDSEKADAEGKSRAYAYTSNPKDLIDAVEFHGSVQGKLLIEWGMSEDEIDDPLGEYDVEVWLIGRWVIKAVLNPDPLKRRRYYVASYVDIPGAFWGLGLPDIIRDLQDVCNASARALVNNMSIAAGPQVWVDVDQMPPGEELTSIYPLKIWQVSSLGGGGAARQPLGFFMPESNAKVLMGVYEKFSNLADEHSGIPRFLSGESPYGGVGRTASGLSMLQGNASKLLKELLNSIDKKVLEPMLRELYFFNMRYSDDPALKGDVQIIARGALSLFEKETMQVRRNEFLANTANPIDSQIVGEQGRAEILRETAKSLGLNPDKVVPPPEVLRARQAEMMLAQQRANSAAAGMADAAAQGALQGVANEVMAKAGNQQTGQGQVVPGTGSGQNLANNAPVTDLFQPQGA